MKRIMIQGTVPQFFSVKQILKYAVVLLLLSSVIHATGFAQTSWYSYQSGDWNDTEWRTWTTDPSGTTLINPSHLMPGATDDVIILNGRIVTIPMGTTGRTVASVTIQEGAVLDISNTTGHSFGSQLNGSGLLRLSTATFPNFAAGSFVQTGGGTVEYRNMTGFTFSQVTYNNLIINLNNNTDEALFVTTSNPFTVNGNITIEKGLFRISDNANTTALTVNFNGDVTVNANGQIAVGNRNIGSAFGMTNRSHQITITGNLYNNGGTVRFTNMTGPVYTANPPGGAQAGWSDVIFNNANADQYVDCNGITIFYRIQISKGTDQTYVLNIDADGPDQFFLYGRNDRHTSYDPTALGPDVPNIVNLNALGLLSGTCRLGNNIALPALSSQYYILDEDAALWLDASQLRYYISNLNRGIYIYGKLKLTNNALFNMDDGTASQRRGIVTREASSIIVDNSTLQATLIRTSSLNSYHRGAFFVSGNSTVTLSGNTSHGYHATLSFGYPDNVINISGGVINIENPTIAATDMSPGSSGMYFSVMFGSLSKNINLTGGTFNINIPGGNNAYINSTVPFYNLNITGTNLANDLRIVQYTNPGTGTAPPTLAPQPLIVLNDLMIQNNAVLNTTVPAPDVDVTIGGDFTVSTNGIYRPGDNTTSFDGNGSQIFDIQGTINPSLYNLTLANTSSLTLNNPSAIVPVVVRSGFNLNHGCTFIDNGRILEVQGNVLNSGVHFKPVSGAGSIQLTGTASQVINGDGTGVFNNLTLNKTAGSVSLQADISLAGDLRLANTAARFNIGSNNLSISATGDVFDNLTGTGKNFSATRMIQTTGKMSDGGISKVYNSTNAFLFPFGFYNATNATYYYMPASIRYSSAPAAYGTVTSRPVNARHPLAQTTNALACYWKTFSTGFTGVPAGSVVHNYTYDPLSNYFVSGTESNYIPAVYRNSDAATWITINNPVLVNDGTNVATYDTAYKADGDYTAGEPDAFTPIQIRYSTGINGDWDNTATWSATAVGGPGGASIPDANTIVIIGDTVNNHTVFVNQNSRVCGSLSICNGSTLDLRDFTGHNFEAFPDQGVKGTGTLRIASDNYFPRGDFGDFIGESGGTVEYYTIAPASITIPVNSDVTGLMLDHYYNLKVSPATGTTITFPNSDLLIYNDLTKADAGQVNTNTLAVHNVQVTRDFIIEEGIFEVQNTNIQHIRVLKDMEVDGTFRVQNGTAVDHTLELYGNLSGTGTFDANYGGERIWVYFKGLNDASITGSDKTFYSLEVDKGTDQTPVLNVRAGITTSFDPAVTLKNGTFRIKQGSLNLSQASSFTIPVTACLSIDSMASVTVAVNNTDNTLFLIGKLELLGGMLNIGSPANVRRNCIEYSSEGNPEIVINGGVLNINGQIKRNSSTTFGALDYRQQGGTVNIYGENQDNTRGKFEICNEGSYFGFSGGTINIYNGGGVTFGDVYLRPSNSAVNDNGTIAFVPLNNSPNQDFKVDASCPLGNLTINGYDGNDSAVVHLMVNPLVLLGDLTINDGFSRLNCNSLNVTVAGDFTNNGIYTAGTNTTIFNGGMTQTASFGVNTTFRKLLIDKTVGSISFTSPGAFVPTITDTLTINSGTLMNSGTLDIIVQGDIINNSVHTSTGSGSLILQGSTNQIIAGNDNGQFGNLTLANGAANGATLTANILINGTLTLTTGYLYINDYLMTLASTAAIGGTPGIPANKNWITTNGVLSDGGIKRVFPAGPSSFTYPIGVAGKYTPVTFDATYTSPGSITVKPVNIKIPSLTNALADELQYYWHVSSTPFTGLSSITHTYKYLDADVLGNEDLYVGARYYNNNWTNFGKPGVMDVDANTITITGTDIDGEYTCGEPGNFLSKPVYYSYYLAPGIDNPLVGADWNTAGTWAIGGHTGTPATIPPDGNPIIIRNDHTVFIADSDRVAYSVDNFGILNIGYSVGHSLGHVRGDGRIIVINTLAGQFVFPGGDFSEFMDTPGSTVEYNGSNGTIISSISSTYKKYQNLEFTGPINKILANVNLLIKGNLLITESQVDNSVYYKNITLWGDWTDNVTHGFIPGKSTVSFEGSTLQTVNTPDPEHFYRMKIYNAAGVTLNGSAEVSYWLVLLNGRLNTTTSNLLTITNTSTNAASGASDASFVDGPLAKRILAGQYFNFPVGNYNASAAKPARYGNIYLSNTSAYDTWTAQYINANPDGLYSRSNLLPPLTSVSDNEYWIVTRTGGNNANIRLRWDAYSNIASVYSTRVTEWTPANQWEEKGNLVSGTLTAGTISTTAPVTTGIYIFTLGVSGVTARITNVTPTSICNNGEVVTVTVALTGNPNWTLTYSAGGNSYTQSGIGSSTFNIQLTGSDFGGPGTHNIQLTAISDASSSGMADPTVYPVTVLDTYIPDIQGTFTVGAGEVRNFYTTDNSGSGSTYAWSWIGASGGTIDSPNAASTDITMATAATYQLQVAETTYNGCVATDVQSITVLDTPSPDITPDDANVCLNESVTYSTPNIAGHTYAWTVVGGTPATGTGNSINVTWNATGNGSVSVIESNGPLFGTDVVNVVVDPQPNTSLMVTAPPSVCDNTSAIITVESSQTGFNYQLRDGIINIGTPAAGTGGNINLPSDLLTTATTFNVLAYNNGCSEQLIQTRTVDVIPLPDAAGTITGTAIVCQGQSGMAYSVPAIDYATSYVWNYTGIGATITGGTTRNITIAFAANATGGDLTVYG
ncbi:MAG: hypothetical protein JW973_15090, partial [Bacteroidales bacterium]|nr:hypothetical protein [Bacteroidales bacterium]